jgi:hypothetical protein
MSEKSISEQIIDEFIESLEKTGKIDKDNLVKLKVILDTEKPKKADILHAMGGTE